MLPPKLRAKLEAEAYRRGLSLTGGKNPYEKYQTDPYGYATTELGVTPWSGRGSKGQKELYDDIGDSVRRQRARDPGAPRVFRVQAGNGLGKTYGIAPLVNWFFDAFAPSIVYTTGPGGAQVRDTLWKSIKAQRPSNLPGRVLPVEARMEKAPNHFATAKTTSDAGGTGEERFKGQHDRFVMLVVDEADGVAKFVFDAIIRMMTGGEVIIVILIGNPRSRNSEFFRWSRRAGVMNYRWSALDHPNVVDGADTIPGATSREWVIARIWEWCEVTDTHDPDRYTFTLPFDVPPPPEEIAGAHGPAGTIFAPIAEFLTSIMGITPPNATDNTFVPGGRYEAATKRQPPEEDPRIARIGVDVAGFGKDFGTIYVRHCGRVWRAAQLWKLDQAEYYLRIKEEIVRLIRAGVTDLQVRIDAGGGFAGGVIALLERDDQLRPRPPEKRATRGAVQSLGLGSGGRPVVPAETDPVPRLARFEVIAVHFNGVPYNGAAYANLITEMMAEAAETLKGIALIGPPETLETDLCDRIYDWVNKHGVWVKEIEPKRVFRKRQKRSPDDGDGFVLCVAPDFLFPTQDDDGFS